MGNSSSKKDSGGICGLKGKKKKNAVPPLDKNVINYLSKWIDSGGEPDQESFRKLLGKYTSLAQAPAIREGIIEKFSDAMTDERDRRLLAGCLAFLEASQLNVALFFPSEASFQELSWYIKSATISLDICVFTITDDRISNALIGIFHRGVAVRVITDDERTGDRGSDIMRFVEAGIPVLLDNSPSHMHNKFCIVDGALLISGSYNWTVAAAKHNQENVIVTDNEILIKRFQDEFDKLWSLFRPNLLK